jgi:ribosome biogenesis protein MAK21
MHVVDLLKSKPEQEVNLLRLAVNKLGDSDRKVASRVSYHLLQLEEAHPAMKAIIVDAISELVFRVGSDYHAKYYSVITLNQTILAHKDTDVANKLIRFYLTLFERLLAEWDKEKVVKPTDEPAKKAKKPRWKNKGNKGKHGGVRQEQKTSEVVKEEENAKLTTAILTGLNRAYPFSDLPRDTFQHHIDVLYRVTHSANFNTSVQALILIYQISKAEQNLSDRYYRTLYESLLDPRLSSSSKLRLYLNLLFKSLREDDNADRVKAFAKRILQMASHWLNIGVVAGVVFLVNELSKIDHNFGDMVSDAAVDADKSYDGRARDPLFSNSQNSKLWEVLPLLNHFHPTVEVYALGLLSKDAVLEKPDLTLHSLSHFLDRFVYKNPRTKATTKGGSIMQPLAGGDTSGLMFSVGASEPAPVNAANWKNVNIDKVDASERFFYQYFINRRETKPEKKTKKRGEDARELSDNEEEVWNALVNSRPDVEGEDEDLSGFSDEDLDLDEDISDLSDIESEEEDEEKEEQEQQEEDEESEPAEDSEGEPVTLADFEDSEGMFDSEEEIEEEKEPTVKGKRPLADESDGKKPKNAKRSKLKDLPVFASVDEYAQYLESSDEDYS